MLVQSLLRFFNFKHIHDSMDIELFETMLLFN